MHNDKPLRISTSTFARKALDMAAAEIGGATVMIEVPAVLGGFVHSMITVLTHYPHNVAPEGIATSTARPSDLLYEL